MFRTFGCTWLLASFLIAGCGTSGSGNNMGADGGSSGAERTVDSCTTNIATGAPAFFQMFRCVDVSVSGTNISINTQSLPPHKSYYYGAGSPNYTAFDTSRGAMYKPNPNKIATLSKTFQIPSSPVPKGITITTAMVDTMANTNPEEYPLGPVGVALDSVTIFNDQAAPGDNIANEAYTFDSYNAHPDQMGEYHYHTNTPGPLEVLKAQSLVTSTQPGSAELEIFGIMCDGTVVLGCTEASGAAASSAGLDAQNGHVHDIMNKSGAVLFSNRYHTHVCPTKLGGHKYTPEIQYYKTCTRL
jgi:hypothetical protein